MADNSGVTLHDAAQKTDPPGDKPARLVLPPAGPPWFASVMGTAILASLLEIHANSLPGAHVVAPTLLVLAWIMLIGLSTGFVIRIIADRRVLANSLRDSTVLPMWGPVAMSVLAVGSATATVLPNVWPGGSGVAFFVDALMWVIGTVLGVLTAFGFAAVLVRKDMGHPTPVWGLPLVPPMVSATTGSALIEHIPSGSGQFLMMVACAACFFLALFLGIIVFAISYRHHWRYNPVPLAASASTWIPLGIVGQSTAAAQAMANPASTVLAAPAAATAHLMADIYGYCMLAVGVPLIGYAIVVTARGFAGRMPFSTGWWAMTFPIGTLSLGSHMLGVHTGSAFFLGAGLLACLVLACSWSLCSVASIRALRTVLAHRKNPMLATTS